jgi:hypothetical protein
MALYRKLWEQQLRGSGKDGGVPGNKKAEKISESLGKE